MMNGDRGVSSVFKHESVEAEPVEDYNFKLQHWFITVLHFDAQAHHGRTT